MMMLVVMSVVMAVVTLIVLIVCQAVRLSARYCLDCGAFELTSLCTNFVPTAGEDLGVVTELLTSAEYTAIRNKERSSGQFNEDERVLRHILRVANQFDCQLLPEKFHDEKIVVEVYCICSILYMY